MKAIYMKPPNNRVDGAPAAHLLSPKAASNTRTGLHLIEMLAKGICGNPQTIQEVAETVGWATQADTKWRYGAGVYFEPSSLFPSIFGTGRHSACYQEK